MRIVIPGHARNLDYFSFFAAEQCSFVINTTENYQIPRLIRNDKPVCQPKCRSEMQEISSY